MSMVEVRLTLPDEATAIAIGQSIGAAVEDSSAIGADGYADLGDGVMRYFNAVVCSISDPTGETDDEGFPVYALRPGYHVLVRIEGESGAIPIPDALLPMVQPADQSGWPVYG